MLKKLKNKIEEKRNSKNFIWKGLIFGKDFIWRLNRLTDPDTRLIWERSSKDGLFHIVMDAKIRFSKKTIKKILSNYKLGELIEFKPFEEEHNRTTIFLKTTKGKFVLKCYKYCSKESLLFETCALYYFYEHKYPCIIPIRNIHESFIGNFQNKQYIIFKYIRGKHIQNLNKKQSIELVKYLAKLHNLSQGYKPRYSEFRDSINKKYCLATAKNEYKRFNSKEIAEKRLNYLKEHLNSLKFPDSIPRGVIHGDYKITNIKFRNNKIEGVLDFGMACYTYLIYDTASLVYWWTWRREKKLNFAKAKFLLDNYDKYHKLSRVEKEHIYDALKLVLLRHMSCFFYDKYKGIDYFKDSQKKIEELEKIGCKEFNRKLFG